MFPPAPLPKPLWASTFDQEAVSDRLERFKLQRTSLRVALFYSLLLAGFSLLAMIAAGDATRHESASKNRAASALSLVFSINLGASMLFLAILLSRTSFELQVDRDEASRNDFPLLAWLGVLFLGALFLVFCSALLFGWGVGELLSFPKVFASSFPLIALLAVAFIVPLLASLPVGWTQRPRHAWAHLVSNDPAEVFEGMKYACTTGDWYALDTLLARKTVDINQIASPNGQTLLHFVVGGYYDTLVERLVEAGAVANIQDTSGENACHLAAKLGYYKILCILSRAAKCAEALEQKDNTGARPADTIRARGIPTALQSVLIRGDP